MQEEKKTDSPSEKKSVFGVIVHSFFVVPFLIAVFAVLLFAAVRMLTVEKKTSYDYLEDVKIGGLTKRWQAAFELSKILADPNRIPKDDRFNNELISAFRQAKHDDNRVRQYLALAMGRSGNVAFVLPLTEGLAEEAEENLSALIYAIGMLRDKDTALLLHPYLDHSDSYIRLTTAIALGNIGNSKSIGPLKKVLQDSEPNVSWDAAIALAKMKDASGKNILLNLLRRDYLAGFSNIDAEERNHILQVVIEAAGALDDPDLDKAIRTLSETDPNMNVRKIALAATK